MERQENVKTSNAGAAPFLAVLDALQFGCTAVLWIGAVSAALGLGFGIWALVK